MNCLKQTASFFLAAAMGLSSSSMPLAAAGISAFNTNEEQTCSHSVHSGLTNTIYLEAETESNPPEASIQLNRTSLLLQPGMQAKLQCSSSDSQVTWSSSSPSVAWVDEQGTVWAQKDGSADIEAALPDGQKAVCHVVVKKVSASQSQYDARDYGLITSAKLQLGSTCWAYSIISCLETSAIQKGLVPALEDADPIDLDEWHLIWYGRNGWSGSTDSSQDGYELVNLDTDSLFSAGNSYILERTAFNVSGLANASSMPDLSVSWSSASDSSAKTAMLQALQENYTAAYKNVSDYRLDSVVRTTYTKEALKKAVLEYGSAKIHVHDTNGTWNLDNNAYYTYQPDGSRSVNHAITIIGWDDDYSAENFSADTYDDKSYTPSGNGAWLCKNSNKPGCEFFWLSYEDQAFNTSSSGTCQAIHSYTLAPAFDQVYFYDGTGSHGVSDDGSNTGQNTIAAEKEANIFKASQDITLSKVGYGLSPYDDASVAWDLFDYTLSVYLLSDGYTSPEDGSLLYTQSGTTDKSLYIDLKEPISISKGVRFSVVISGCDKAYVEGQSHDEHAERPSAKEGTSMVHIVSHEKESYYCADGTWHDASADGYNNVCVRAVAMEADHTHTPGRTEILDYTDAACEKDGSYTEVVYCADCGAVISSEKHTIPQPGHTLNTQITVLKEATCTEDGLQEKVMTCDVCQEVLTDEEEVVPALGHDPLPVVREDVVEPTCTQTGSCVEVAYCSRCNQKLGSVPVEIEKAPHEEGRQEQVVVTEPTCSSEGQMDTITYCKNCDAIMHQTSSAIEKVDHTPAEAVQENKVPSDCAHEGSMDEVVYCSECHAELSRETVVIEKLDHEPADPVQENIKEPQGDDPGTYEEVIYCQNCHEELSRQTKEIEPHDHEPAEAVIVNEVEPTCEQDGGYDEVVYCTICHTEMEREHTTIAKTGHTEGEAVQENYVEPTCTTAGSYHEVIYCETCGQEVSRTTKTVAKTEHHYDYREYNGHCKDCLKAMPSDYPDVVSKDGDINNPWYYGHVMEARDRGLMTGTDEGTFEPDKSLNRAQTVTVLWRMAGAPEMEYEDVFSDVKEDVYYTDAVIWAWKNGVVTGYENGEFGVNDPIQRQDLSVMFYRYTRKICQLPAEERADLSSFKDADSVSPYAQEAMEWIVAAGLIRGNDKDKDGVYDTLDPHDPATRAQFAKLSVFLEDYTS